MMVAAKRNRFYIDPTMLWVLLFVVASDGLTVAGIVALVTQGARAMEWVGLFGLGLLASVLALHRIIERGE